MAVRAGNPDFSFCLCLMPALQQHLPVGMILIRAHAFQGNPALKSQDMLAAYSHAHLCIAHVCIAHL